jgi:glyoxylase-like metal-dependent hydrolase (beta-lactamase superfamily II)
MIKEADHREEVAFYLVAGSRDVAVIDTGLGGGDLRGFVKTLTTARPLVLQTHLHWDHIGASRDFEEVRAHVAEAIVRRAGWPWEPPDATRTSGGTAAERPVTGSRHQPTGTLRHGDRIDLGGRSLAVIHSPGHSPGSVTFLDRDARVLFCGDLCYLGQMLLFVKASDLEAFRSSMHALADLAGDVDAVYPAHGPAPLTGDDVLAIRGAFETVWTGRRPDRRGTYEGHRVAIHDFGRFAFLVPPG